MADPKGFLKIKRQSQEFRPVCERIKDYAEVLVLRSDENSQNQASRCMDCGIPFCHWGCPIGNLIPEWNDAIFKKQWEKAFELLSMTNNLPEITGRICPAPCEYACVLGINDDPVTIRENELTIIEYAYKVGFVKPKLPKTRTRKSAAVVGSGPAGLSCAAQLNQAGHKVVVFERDDKIGGILRYGIPDFKLEKWVIDRRVDIWKQEGIEFITGDNLGGNFPVSKLLKEFDAVCLTCGSRVPRDLKIEGRDLKEIHFAMDYLTQNNRRTAGEKISPQESIDAMDKKVVVIGGGDTGADCVGTAHRQGAKCVIQIEVMPRPSECRTDDYPWPKYPLLLKTSTSHQEGGERNWSILTKKFIGERGNVKKLSCVRIEFPGKDEKGCPIMREIPGSEFEIEADLVIIAVGFLYPEQSLLKELNIVIDERGNVKTDNSYMTSLKGIFAAGDMRRGQSLIVWAIAEGRRTAHCIDKFLTGCSSLPVI